MGAKIEKPPKSIKILWRPHIGTFWKLLNMTCTKVLELMETTSDFQTSTSNAEGKNRTTIG